MKCCEYKTGDFRSLITIERQGRTTDDMGGYTIAWAADPAGGVWAKWEATSSRERYLGMREGFNVDVRAVIRFRDDGNGAPYYTTADRISYRGRYYDIRGVRDPDDRRRWLILDLQEGEKS